MKKHFWIGLIGMIFLLASCNSVRTYSDNTSPKKPYQKVVVYGIYDGDQYKSMKKFTEALVDKLEDEGLKVKKVVKELEKHGLRRNPPVLNKRDDSRSKIEAAVNGIGADLLLVTKLGSLSQESIGIDVVAVDVESQDEFWTGTTGVPANFILRNTGTRRGVKNLYKEMQKDGIFN